MKLKYTLSDKVIIGSHTQEEQKFQLANHYNMVEGHLDSAFQRLNKIKYDKLTPNDLRWELEQLERCLGNIKAQHFNEGVSIKLITDLQIKSF